MILVISCSIIYYAEPTGRDELSVAHSDFESLVSHIGLNAQILRSKASYTGSQPSTKSCCSPCRTRELHLFPIKDLTVLCTPLEIFVLIWRKWSWSLSHCISMAKKKKRRRKTTFTNESQSKFLPAPFCDKRTLKRAHRYTSHYAGDVWRQCVVRTPSPLICK